MYVATGDHAAAKAVVGDISHSKLQNSRASKPKVVQDTVKSNREYLVQFYQRNNDANAVPTVQQLPATWSFTDRGSEKSFGGM